MTQITNIGVSETFENKLWAGGIKTIAILLGFAVTGCASYQKDHFKVGSVPSDYRTKHPIIVSQSEVATDILVSSNAGGMNYETRNKVIEFLSRFKRSGAGHIRILIPSGSHNERAARAVSGDIVNLVREEGIGAAKVSVERYNASGHGDAATLRLSFGSVSARVHSKCGQWNEDLLANSENVNYQNFGCATQNNLANMIANPEDLITPRGQSEIDASRRDTVIENWRSDGTSDLPSLL